MFYKHEPPLPQIRHHCRNPRCAGKLKTTADNSRDAFCCSGCEKQYYDRHCRSARRLISPPKTKLRAVCWRSQCRHEFQRHPERFFGVRYPSGPLGQISSRNPIKPGLKIGAKSGRGWRMLAGPKGHAANYRVPLDAPASKANRNFEEHCRKAKRRAARKALIKRKTPPVNLIGGYRFPNAPQLDPDLILAILEAEGVVP